MTQQNGTARWPREGDVVTITPRTERARESIGLEAVYARYRALIRAVFEARLGDALRPEVLDRALTTQQDLLDRFIDKILAVVLSDLDADEIQHEVPFLVAELDGYIRRIREGDRELLDALCKVRILADGETPP